MTENEHIMTTAAEEAVEVAQRITKALRFGVDEVQPGQQLSNGERILQEFHDLWSMLKWMAERGLMPGALEPSREIADAKRAKVRKFMAISREQGTLA